MSKRTGRADAIDAHVGRRITVRRTLLGLTQTGLAKQCGITFQQLQKYESGFNRVSASMLWKIADALKVEEIGYFFPKRGKEKQDPDIEGTRKNLELIKYLEQCPPPVRNRFQALVVGIANATSAHEKGSPNGRT